MRFGGHETFAIREGWLHKGLKLLLEDPNKLHDPYVADWLGVGRNMGKSIKHWLLATGLAEVTGGVGKHYQLGATPLGKLVFENDPYFLEAGTWWALHVELVGNHDYAVTWWWFFNHFSLTRFDRAMCLSALKTHLELHSARVPAHKTLQRDLACLISSYATPVPADQSDPEDADDCPLRELGLMTYSRVTGSCVLNVELKAVPVELFGYAVAKALLIGATGKKPVDVTLRELASLLGGPGKAFVMGPDALFELALSAEQALGRASLEIASLGAERLVKIAPHNSLHWLANYYDRIRKRSYAA